jgi:Ankyrin repeats (3 copies)
MKSNINEVSEVQRSKFLLFHSREEENCVRPLTVIAGFPLYCSTGINSKVRGTWFPFSGINHETFSENNETYQSGWLIKPKWNTELNLNKYFPEKLVDNLSLLLEASTEEELSMYSSVISRFGNFEAMFLSLLIGGGFWQTKPGNNLKNFIIENFPEEMNTIKKYYSVDIQEVVNFIHNPNITLIQVMEDEKEHIQKINDWLISNGSKSNKDQNNRPEIDFAYNNISVSLIQSINLIKTEIEQTVLFNEIPKFFSSFYNTAFNFFKNPKKEIQTLKNPEKEIKPLFNKMKLSITESSEPPYLLAEAIHTNDLEKIKLLLSKYSVSELQELDYKDGCFYPPLHIACKEGKFEVVSLLLSQGFDVNLPARNAGWRIALSFAVENNHESIVQLLLNNKADINRKDNFDRVAFDWQKKF